MIGYKSDPDGPEEALYCDHATIFLLDIPHARSGYVHCSHALTCNDCLGTLGPFQPKSPSETDLPQERLQSTRN